MRKNKILKIFKQAIAGLLASALAISWVPVENISYAAVLPVNTGLNTPGTSLGLLDYSKIPVTGVGGYTFGNSNSTAYAFGPVTDATNGFSGFNSFNIAAITNADVAKNNTKGYLNGTGDVYTGGTLEFPEVTSAYMLDYPLMHLHVNNWWSTYYAFGKSISQGALPSQSVDPSGVTYGADGITPITATAPGTAAAPFTPAANGAVTEVAIPSSTDKLEVKMEVKPSNDGQNILVKYTVYNPTSNHVDFWIGNGSDTQIYNTDGSHAIINENQTHLHMMDIIKGVGIVGNPFNADDGSNQNNENGLADFDVRLADHNNDENRVWVGQYPDTPSGGPLHTEWVFGKNAKDNIFVQGMDSAAAWSSYFSLDGHEMKYSSFTISMRVAVYYVDSMYTGPNPCGYITLPFTSVKDAVEAMKHKGVKKGYIFLVNDDIVNDTIEIPQDLDVQIVSSPYANLSGLPITKNISGFTDGTLADKSYIDLDSIGVDSDSHGAIRSIKRGAGLADTEPIFKVNKTGSKMQLYNITVDGDNVTAKSPLIDVSEGSVVFNAGTTIKNAKVSGNNTAGAVRVKDNGSLNLNGQGGAVNITNNESLDNGSAIMIDSTLLDYPVTINGEVKITDNVNKDGKANVNIGKKFLWVEKGNIFTGKIGINTENTPKTNEQGTPIVDFEDRGGAVVTTPYSTANFTNDITGQHIEEADISNIETPVTPIPPGTPVAQALGRLYLTASFRNITVSYVDKDGNNIAVNQVGETDQNKFPTGTINPVTVEKAVGSKVGEDSDGGIITAPSLPGYMIRNVSFTPDYAEKGRQTGSGVNTVNGSIESIIRSDGSLTGNIGGTIYLNDVDITVEYVLNGKTYKFDSQGGNSIADKYETIGS